MAPEALPFQYHLDSQLIAGEGLASPARVLEAYCHVQGHLGPYFVIQYDAAGDIAYLFAGFLTNSWYEAQRDFRARHPSASQRGPTRLHTAATRARLHFTDDPGMYLREQGEEPGPGYVPWNGVALDLTDGVPATGHYDDWFPFTYCHRQCIDDRTLPHLGMCVDDTGRINGLFIEAPAEALPRPGNAALRVRGSGAWPDD